MTKLKDICVFYSGTGFPTVYQGKPEGDYPFYKVGDISQNVQAGNIFLNKSSNHIDYDAISKIKGTVIPENTVVFAKIGEAVKLNRRAITTRPCLVDNNVMGLCPNRQMVDVKYFYYLLCSIKMEKLAEATTVPSVKKSVLEKLVINLPCINEQKEIAYKLDKIVEIIDQRKQQLSKLNELVKSRFVELFGDINVNDKGWDTEPLGNLCDISRGGSPRPIEQYLGGTIPWIKIGDATKGDNVYLHTTKEHIIQEGVKKSRLVKKGSLIFANCGVSLGFARIITFDGCIHDGWLAMENIDNRLDKVFLLQALNQMTEHFRVIAPAGTQPNLNTAIMKAYMQIIPPIELQKKYIDFVEQTDKSKLAIQQSLEQLETLKKSLMQQYFG